MNQKLFDECTQAYKTDQKKERERARQRLENWKKLDQLARANPDMEKITSMMRNCMNEDVVMSSAQDDDSDGGGGGNGGNSAGPASGESSDSSLTDKGGKEDGTGQGMGGIAHRHLHSECPLKPQKGR